MHTRDATAEVFPETFAIRGNGFALGRTRTSRTRRADDAGGPFLEQSGGFPLLVAAEPAPGRVGRLACHLRQLQRQRVAHGLMPAGVRDEHRMIGGRAVQVPAGRWPPKLRFLIARTCNPEPSRGPVCLPFQDVDEFVDVPHLVGTAIDIRPGRPLWIERPWM